MDNLASLLRTAEGLQAVCLSGNGIGSLGTNAGVAFESRVFRHPPRHWCNDAHHHYRLPVVAAGITHVAKALALSTVTLTTLKLGGKRAGA